MMSPDTGAPRSTRRKGYEGQPRHFEFSFGAVLQRTFACFGKHGLVLCLFALVIFVPLAAWKLHGAEAAFREPAQLVDVYGDPVRVSVWDAADKKHGILGALLDAGLPLLLQAVVALGVFQFLGGAAVSYGKSLSRGLGRFLPVIGAALLMAVITILVMIPVMLFLGILITAVESFLFAAVVAGVVTLAVIAVIQCIFFVMVPAVVVEGIGPSKGLSRSSYLTRGARWKILGVVLVLGVPAAIVEIVIHSAIGVSPDWGEVRMGVLLSVAVTAVFAVLMAVAAAVVYTDLRRAKEGVTTAELIDVFA